MSGPAFHQTVMGRRLIEGDLPRLVDALGRIADALTRIAVALERRPASAPADAASPVWPSTAPSPDQAP